MWFSTPSSKEKGIIELGDMYVPVVIDKVGKNSRNCFLVRFVFIFICEIYFQMVYLI